jgi:hypothetical protein
MGAPTRIHPVFSNNIANHQTTSQRTYEGNIDSNQRIWRLPPGWATDPLNIPLFRPPFERVDIDKDYVDTFLTDEGREADAMAAKWQGDHVGSQERAFRYRHKSNIRCCMHAANRRNGHSKTDSGIHARVLSHVVDLIQARNAGD